jgi:hypothetical protein
MKNSWFAGWLLQRELNNHWTLGAEIYSQQARQIGARQTTFVDFGGYYSIRQNLSLLFMCGHTVSGEHHANGYFGLYYTWGQDKKGPQPSSTPAAHHLLSQIARALTT